MFVQAENTGKGFITHEDHNSGLSFKSLGGNVWKVEGSSANVNSWVTRVGGTEVPSATMEETAKSIKVNEIYAHARNLIDTAVVQYSHGETSVWRDLEKEAEQFQVDGTVGELMQNEINSGGRTAAEIAPVVLAKASVFHAFRAAVVANRTNHISSVNALTDPQTILDYDFGTGWPSLS